MPGSIKVEVTAEDIANGVKGDCTECPIARAIMRHGYTDVEVMADYILYGHSGTPDYATARTPYRAGDFIHDFDQGKPVEPFAFDLEPREPTDG